MNQQGTSTPNLHLQKDIDEETINVAVAAMLKAAGWHPSEADLESMADDIRIVLWAVEYPQKLQRIADLEVEMRRLREQTARDAATIKRIQDLSVVRLASHQQVVDTLRKEIVALR